jgi:5S rRNA maturation endonuclease (ribonuclease M5)
MDEAGIRGLLDALGCERISNRGPNWIQCACPFSDRHKNHRDRNPSFGVRINSNGTSGWACYTCHEKGWIGGLPEYVEKFTGRRFDVSIHEMAKADGALTMAQIKAKLAKVSFWNPPQVVSGVRFSRKGQNDPDYEPTVIPDLDFKKYEKHTLESILYLQGPQRKLTVDTIQLWGLGWDEEDRRIVIPIRDKAGKLLAYSKRLYEREGEKRVNHKGKRLPKYLHSKGFKRDYLLYGEHQIMANQRHCIIVEGFFDVIYLWQCGYRNAVAIMGSYLSDVQERKIKKWFDSATILTDGDDAGRDMADAVAKSLRPEVTVSVLYCPEEEDANDQSPEQLRDLLGPPDILVD